jgi:hypothetical protein
MTPAGFPHSDIFGSTPACDSPKLFAANHVLHRLLTPRHSPCALSSLVTNLPWNPKGAPQTPELTYVDPEAPAWDESQTGKNCLIATFSIAIRRLQGRMDFDTAEATR